VALDESTCVTLGKRKELGRVPSRVEVAFNGNRSISLEQRLCALKSSAVLPMPDRRDQSRSCQPRLSKNDFLNRSLLSKGSPNAVAN
jgi:hypothetical protein